MNSRSLPLISVSGSHREMGRQIGEAAREQISHSIDNARTLLHDAYETLQLDWEGALIQSRKYLPFAEERYPQYVDEMRGIAEGPTSHSMIYRWSMPWKRSQWMRCT